MRRLEHAAEQRPHARAMAFGLAVASVLLGTCQSVQIEVERVVMGEASPSSPPAPSGENPTAASARPSASEERSSAPHLRPVAPHPNAPRNQADFLVDLMQCQLEWAERGESVWTHCGINLDCSPYCDENITPDRPLASFVCVAPWEVSLREDDKNNDSSESGDDDGMEEARSPLSRRDRLYLSYDPDTQHILVMGHARDATPVPVAWTPDFCATLKDFETRRRAGLSLAVQYLLDTGSFELDMMTPSTIISFKLIDPVQPMLPSYSHFTEDTVCPPYPSSTGRSYTGYDFNGDGPLPISSLKVSFNPSGEGFSVFLHTPKFPSEEANQLEVGVQTPAELPQQLEAVLGLDGAIALDQCLYDSGP